MMTNRKILIPLAFSLFVAAFFTATQPLRPEMAIVSSIFVVLFALPSYRALVISKGLKRGLAILAVLSFYALLIETSAIHTGFPYGDFIYNDLLGEKIFGLTPWTVAFAWPPILLLSFWAAKKLLNNPPTLKLLCASALFAVAIDLVLDPAAVELGFWNWREPGLYYEVPLVNFLGWLLSSFIGAGILHRFWGESKVPVALSYSGIAILWFWTWVNVFQANVIPVVVGFVLLYVFLSKIRSKEVY